MMDLLRLELKIEIYGQMLLCVHFFVAILAMISAQLNYMNSKISILFVALLSLSQPLSAQVKNCVIDSVNSPYTSLLAVNPKDQKNIIAGALRNTLFYSFDEGLTWQKSVVEPAASDNSNGAIVVDSKGHFFYFYLADSGGVKNRLVMQHSEDGGKTWEVNDGLGLNLKQTCFEISPYVDASNDLYITWTQPDKILSEADCKSNVFISKSSNKGKKWNDPILLSQTPGNCLTEKILTGSSAAVVGDKKKFAAWMSEEKIIMDRSYDGKIWLNNDIVVTQRSAQMHACQNFNGSAGLLGFTTDNGKSFFRGSLYLLTTEKKTNQDDIHILFFRSHNGGDNWTSPLQFSDDEPGTLQFKPTMAIDQETGMVYVAYYNQPHANDTATDVFISYSKDGGSTFKRMKLNDKSFMPAKNNVSGSYINLTAYNGTIAVAWIEISEGKSKLKSAVLKQEMLFKK
jgi:hypothetical protein